MTYEKSDINYATAVKNKPNLKNNIIIPIANNKPDKSTAEKFESRIFNILYKTKSQLPQFSKRLLQTRVIW